MSGALSTVGFVKGILQSIVVQTPRQIIWPNTGTLLTPPQANAPPLPVFNTIINSYITLYEEGHDELQITEHPVETGSVISDHAFKLPARLVLKIVFTPAAQNPLGALPFSGFISGQALSFGTSVSYLQQLYNLLLKMQVSGSLLTVYTGKRVYSNMLPAVIGQTTDEKTENVLMATISFKEILLASTQSVQVPASEGTDQGALSSPQTNGPVTNQGAQQLQAAPNFT